jgi:HSP20 family molecular chaperone IbpA
MPGVSASGLEVNLEKSLLVIEGTIGEESPSGMSRLHREYGEGSYRRSFTISDAINRDRIAVTIKSGVVEVILPKNEEVKPRKIAVRAA